MRPLVTARHDPARHAGGRVPVPAPISMSGAAGPPRHRHPAGAIAARGPDLATGGPLVAKTRGKMQMKALGPACMALLVLMMTSFAQAQGLTSAISARCSRSSSSNRPARRASASSRPRRRHRSRRECRRRGRASPWSPLRLPPSGQDFDAASQAYRPARCSAQCPTAGAAGLEGLWPCRGRSLPGSEWGPPYTAHARPATRFCLERLEAQR
jgi:hypothetical protein